MKTLPRILIIYTGGTIGMIHDDKSGCLVPFNFADIYEQVPRLSFYEIKIDTLSFDKPIDSSDMLPCDWKKIADKIYENYNDYDGFVILHGTDTMAYTASALSFMFENLSKPIILTGSQLPLGIPRTDGRNNIINAVEIAAAMYQDRAIIPEVCICFENKLYRGNRTYKSNAENFDAFASPNYPLLASVGVSIKYNWDSIAKYPVTKTNLCTTMDDNIAILKLYPGIGQNVVKSILNTDTLRGLVLETYGSGNTNKSVWFMKLLEEAVEKGIIIVNVTQCKGGGTVNIGQYESSFMLGKLGIISGYDIITESAVTKLMYLLGNIGDVEEIKRQMSKSLRGEMKVE